MRVELRDLLELVLVPGLAALLPWRWCFALFKRLARIDWFYRPTTHEALRQAQALGQVPAGTEAQWLATRRLVTMVDHADYYLEISYAEKAVAQLLKIANGSPLIKVTTYSFNKENTPIAADTTFMRADRIRLRGTIFRQSGQNHISAL